jgi:hypothetical protein
MSALTVGAAYTYVPGMATTGGGDAMTRGGGTGAGTTAGELIPILRLKELCPALLSGGTNSVRAIPTAEAIMSTQLSLFIATSL